MVEDVVRLPHVTHAALAARDPTCHPPLQGVVSPQNLELSAGTKGSIKERMVQIAFGLVHKSLHTTSGVCTRQRHKTAPRQTIWNYGNYGELWRIIGNYGEVWGIMGE